MRKYLIYSTSAIIGVIIIFVIYLSIYGIKTERFNNLIIDKIKSIDSKITLDIKDVSNYKGLTFFCEGDVVGFKGIFINLNIINSKNAFNR